MRLSPDFLPLTAAPNGLGALAEARPSPSLVLDHKTHLSGMVAKRKRV